MRTLSWVGRVFASAIIRKIAFLLVACALAYVGMGKAHAQTGCFDRPEIAGTDAWQCPDRESSYNNALSRENAYAVNHCKNLTSTWVPINVTVYFQTNDATWSSYSGRHQCKKPDGGILGPYNTSINTRFQIANECPSPKTWDDSAHVCRVPCSASPNDHTHDGTEANSTYCSDGCEFKTSPISGGVATGNSCTNPYSCAAGQLPGAGGVCLPDLDQDGVSDGNDFAPTDPTNGQDGSDPPPPLPPPPDDPDCAANGTCPDPPGDESDNVSSGGGSCSSPPQSSGDGILAQIAFQSWSARCEQQTGNAKSDAQLAALNEIKDGIALSSDAIVGAINAQGPGASGGWDDGDSGTLSGMANWIGDIKDWLTGDAEPLPEPGPVNIVQLPDGTQEWQSGLPDAGSCPAPETLTISIMEFSQDIELSYEPMCLYADKLHNLVVVLGLLTGVLIIAGVRR